MSNQSELKTMVAYSYLLLSGAVTLLLSMWFASGGIAENYSGDPSFGAPIYLWNIAIWALGVVVCFFKFRLIGLLISSIPLFYFISMFIRVSFLY